MDTLRELGEEIWFNLGDQDLAIALRRAQRLTQGRTLTEAHLELNRYIGVETPVLPMSDRPVRTHVLAGERWWPLQEFLIRARGEGEVHDVQFRGAREAGTTAQVLEAISRAEVIVIGPSNPVISIGPLLAIDQLRDALIGAAAPVVAVSPIVGGEVLKGPTAAFMCHRDVGVSAKGIAALYAGVIDALVSDESPEQLPVPALRTDLLMDGASGRERLARETLEFAKSVASASFTK
jgi:LPPG:FO 2-phospho-L-lactate transferase